MEFFAANDHGIFRVTYFIGVGKTIKSISLTSKFIVSYLILIMIGYVRYGFTLSLRVVIGF